MRNLQQELLDLYRKKDISKIGLRKIARELDINNPQTVKYFLIKLEKEGLVNYFERREVFKKLSKEINRKSLIDVPILGEANCGPASIFAEESNMGSLKLSPGMLEKVKNIFALRACGDSMAGAGIENGDYVIVDADYKVPKVGHRVVSIIDGCANIKRFGYDQDSNVVLLSEPKKEDIDLFPPIYIYKDDVDNYRINGRVIKVIKKPKFD
jgi:SOS-response transcriptional repressor LexA